MLLYVVFFCDATAECSLQDWQGHIPCDDELCLVWCLEAIPDSHAADKLASVPDMPFVDPNHPFFRPIWRRYAVVAAPFAWAFVEMGLGNDLWAYLFAGIGGYLAWNLLIKGPDKTDD